MGALQIPTGGQVACYFWAALRRARLLPFTRPPTPLCSVRCAQDYGVRPTATYRAAAGKLQCPSHVEVIEVSGRRVLLPWLHQHVIMADALVASAIGLGAASGQIGTYVGEGF